MQTLLLLPTLIAGVMSMSWRRLGGRAEDAARNVFWPICERQLEQIGRAWWEKIEPSSQILAVLPRSDLTPWRALVEG